MTSSLYQLSSIPELKASVRPLLPQDSFVVYNGEYLLELANAKLYDDLTKSGKAKLEDPVAISLLTSAITSNVCYKNSVVVFSSHTSTLERFNRLHRDALKADKTLLRIIEPDGSVRKDVYESIVTSVNKVLGERFGYSDIREEVAMLEEDIQTKIGWLIERCMTERHTRVHASSATDQSTDRTIDRSIEGIIDSVTSAKSLIVVDDSDTSFISLMWKVRTFPNLFITSSHVAQRGINVAEYASTIMTMVGDMPGTSYHDFLTLLPMTVMCGIPTITCLQSTLDIQSVLILGRAIARSTGKVVQWVDKTREGTLGDKALDKKESSEPSAAAPDVPRILPTVLLPAKPTVIDIPLHRRCPQVPSFHTRVLGEIISALAAEEITLTQRIATGSVISKTSYNPSDIVPYSTYYYTDLENDKTSKTALCLGYINALLDIASSLNGELDLRVNYSFHDVPLLTTLSRFLAKIVEKFSREIDSPEGKETEKLSYISSRSGFSIKYEGKRSINRWPILSCVL
jgi:hypothetical protein